MLTAEEKLQHFSNMVFEQANGQRDAVLKEAEEDAARRVEAFENECLEKAYRNIQKQVEKIRRQVSEEVSRLQMESRRELLLRRGEILDEVFREAMQRVLAYKKTDEYRGFLSGLVKKAAGEIAGAKSLTAYLDHSDAAYLPELAKEYPDIRFELLDESEEILGGVRMIDRESARMADESLLVRMQEERERFLGESGLNV